jgi:NAD-dependent dihydropyrimidine dehydrogenase PreA subunit
MEMKKDTPILYCDCAYAETLPPQAKQAVLQALKDSGLSYIIVPDLCELAAHKTSLLTDLANVSRLTIAACHPRAVKWLFAAAGAPLRDEVVTYLNMRETSSEELLRSIQDLTRNGEIDCRVEDVSPESLPPHNLNAVNPESGNSDAPKWKPWFPVIDCARCVNCRQCLGFCLFGVYGVDTSGKIQVKNPAGCKTDCPACARICPETAIIFPKYPFPPINGGEGKADNMPAESIKLDRKAIAESDLFKVLQKRSQNISRFSSEDGHARAIQERLARLSGLQDSIDIPLSSLTAQPLSKKEPE